VRQTGERVRLDTGAAQVEMGETRRLIDRVTRQGAPQAMLSGLRSRLAVVLNGTRTAVTARRERMTVVESGPVRAAVEITGTLEAGKQRLGRFLCRVYAYVGLPTLQVQFRVFDGVKPEPYQGTKEDPPLEVCDLALVADLHLPGGKTAVGLVGKPPLTAERGTLTLTQDTAEHCVATLDGAPLGDDRRAQGWIAVEGLQASLWRFWQQCPKSLAADERRLVIGLFAPTAQAPAYRPRFGEAKRHDLWLTGLGSLRARATTTANDRAAPVKGGPCSLPSPCASARGSGHMLADAPVVPAAGRSPPRQESRREAASPMMVWPAIHLA
jgi:hypothetical protein